MRGLQAAAVYVNKQPNDKGRQGLGLASPSDNLFVQHQIRCYQKGYTHPVPLVGAPGVRALPIKFGFEDWEDARSIAKAIAHASFSFDDLVVDDGQVVLPFQHAEPLVLQLDDSDQGLGHVRLAVAAQREGVVR